MNIVDVSVKSSGEAVVEKKNYSREEQLNLFGYVTARDLTGEEIELLEKFPCVLSKTVSEYTSRNKIKQIVTRYILKVMITKRLMVTINLKEEKFYDLAQYYGCDVENYSEFQFKIPVRLFSGRSRRDNRPYYQYEVILAYGPVGTWYVRDYFDLSSCIVIEMNSDLMKKFIVKKSEDDESSEVVDEK